jgi:hypothetical protein|tara:strand:- start:232 stop:486 length:255 start_codon:yes stop_codon:yes gene_type:complete
MKDKANLDKLKQLCDELTDRDRQLKMNAAALWDILEVVSVVEKDLKEVKEKSSSEKEGIERCLENLSKISCIVDSKGCKKVGHE